MRILKENKKTVILFSTLFLLLAIAWISLIQFCMQRSSSQYEYTYDENSMDVEQDGLTVSMDISKSWEDKTLHLQTPVGAQYDFVIKNTSAYMLKDFSVELIFSSKMVLDSGWNGEYEIVDDNKVIFKSIEPTNFVPGGEDNTFGAVMYSEDKSELVGYKIIGFWDASIRDSGWFWPLVEITALLIAALILRINNIYRQRAFDRKMEKEAEIIKQSMLTLTRFIDAKDNYTKDHSTRVAAYAEELGKRFGLSKDEVRQLYYITLMHDCGKISIPDEILKKEEGLSASEFAVIKTHTTKGKELLKTFTAIPGIADGAHYHHERYDGYGYPMGLEGEDIPLYGRIICVADAYDAMSSNRCYRKALSKEKILSELLNNSGKQFDPKFVPIMISMINDGFVDKVKEKYPIE